LSASISAGTPAGMFFAHGLVIVFAPFYG